MKLSDWMLVTHQSTQFVGKVSEMIYLAGRSGEVLRVLFTNSARVARCNEVGGMIVVAAAQLVSSKVVNVEQIGLTQVVSCGTDAADNHTFRYCF